MPGWIGLPELIVLLVVLLLIFGPKRLPEMGRSLGRGMREFKDSVTGKHEKEEHAQLTAAAVEDEAIPTVTSTAREHDAVG
jgi:sec-independent protein translocase protein TatA